MYSVFLVEDEIVVREGIRNGLPWDEINYTLVGEAPDGEMALSILKDVKPDILVTDIRMPFMDGLALARVVKKTQPWIKIIILSGHDEFSYAREAISIGVEEYLLKPVSSSDMLKTLDKVAASIEAEKRELDGIEDLKKKARSHAEIIREKWLCDFAAGATDPAGAIEAARSHGVDLVSRYAAVVVAEITPEADDFRELERARRIAVAYAEKLTDAVLFCSGVERLVLILKSDSPEGLEEAAYTIAQGIKFEAERNARCGVSVGIGAAVNRVSEIPRSFAEASRALKYLGATARRAVVGIGDIEALDEADIARLGNDPVADRLRYLSRPDIEPLVAQYRDMLGDNPGKAGFIGYYLLYDVIVAAASLVAELRGDSRSVLPAPIQQDRLMEIAGSSALFEAEIRRILLAVVESREEAGRGRGSSSAMIERAKRYIDENFASPEISLHSAAEQVNASPNHFSSVFSREAGQSFIEYLTAARIARAKELLSATKMRSADIAYEVGFNDPHYFSFIFKKNTGLTPTEYRSEKSGAAE